MWTIVVVSITHVLDFIKLGIFTSDYFSLIANLRTYVIASQHHSDITLGH